MGNCLHTQLKEVVNNDNLEVLGALKIALAPTGVNYRVLVLDGAFESFKIIGSGKVYSDSQGQNEVTQPVANPTNMRVTYYIGNVAEGDILFIKNKYKLTELNNNAGHLFDGATINPVYLNKMTTINLAFNNVAIDLNELSLYAKDFALFGCYEATSVIGEIETIVENLISLGRNSGTLSIYGYSVNITLNGQLIFVAYADRTQPFTITFGVNSATCTWKGNTVATYDGSSWTYPN